MRVKLSLKMIVRSMIKHKVSSLLVIFTVSLVTVLLCIISSAMNMYADALLQSAEYHYGTWVYAYEDVPMSNPNHSLKADKNALYAYTSVRKQASLWDFTFTVKEIYDPSDILPYHLTKGRFAVNDHEVVICESLSHDPHFRIGNQLSFDTDDVYTIVGIVKDTVLSIDSDIYSLYTEFDKNQSGKADWYEAFPVHDRQAWKTAFQDVTQKQNQNLLDAYQGYDDAVHYRSGSEMKWFIFTVAELIFICMGIVIRTMFRLFFQSRNRYFQLLKQNNFTNRQIQTMTFFEMFFLSCSGIGLGMLFSWGFLHISFLFLNPIFQSFMDADVKLRMIVAWKLLGWMLFAALVIQIWFFYIMYHGMRRIPKPALKKIKRLSPDRIVYTLSKRYIHVHKKARHAVVLTISISFVLISLSTYLAYSINQGLKPPDTYNLSVMGTVNQNAKSAVSLSQHLINVAHEATYRLSIISSLQTEIDGKDITPAYRKASEIDHFMVQFYVLDDKRYRQYVKNKQTNPDRIYYLVDEQFAVDQRDGKAERKVSPFQNNQITITTPESKKVTISIDYMHCKNPDRVESIIPIYTSSAGFRSLKQYFPDEDISYSINLQFLTQNPYLLEKTFQKLNVKEHLDISVQNSEAALKKAKAINLVIQVFLSFLSGVLVLVMAIHIVVTMIISMMLRKSEFAQLHAIGMSGKQLRLMIMNEYLEMSFKGLIIGNGIGYGCTYLLYVLYLYQYGAYQFPWLFMLGCGFLTLSTAIGLAFYTKYLLSKGSLYHAIKQDSLHVRE